MGYQKRRSLAARVWSLAARQHGVAARWQLLELDMHPQAIKHRIAQGRLHPIRRGVYAVGRPQITRKGELMAAVLACGPEAVLSHLSAGELWGIYEPKTSDPVHLSVPGRGGRRRHPGLVIHRRPALRPESRTERDRIPVTNASQTVIDLATCLPRMELEAAISKGDRDPHLDPERLRAAIDAHPGEPGTASLRTLLDRRTFSLTDSELERRFLPLARGAGLHCRSRSTP